MSVASRGLRSRAVKGPQKRSFLAAGGPPFPAFSVTHETVGAPSFAAFAKGGIRFFGPHALRSTRQVSSHDSIWVSNSALTLHSHSTGWSRHLCVKFHDIVYRTFRHILYTLVSSKAAQSRSTAVDRDLSGSISAISVRR